MMPWQIEMHPFGKHPVGGQTRAVKRYPTGMTALATAEEVQIWEHVREMGEHLVSMINPSLEPTSYLKSLEYLDPTTRAQLLAKIETDVHGEEKKELLKTAAAPPRRRCLPS